MRRALASLTFFLMASGLAAADEAVVRVQSIKATSGPGVLKQQRPSDKAPFQVFVNSTGYVQDHYVTDPQTVAALEFLIGGRVGINKNTDIVIVNERSVADGKTSVKRVILKQGALWVKADAKQLKQPLEIQTNGGVMGIKGTEFTVETSPDGKTEVACFESNSEIGGVEIRDNKGKVVTVVKPAQKWLAEIKAGDFVNVATQNYQSGEELRNLQLDKAEFQLLKATNLVNSFLGPFGVYGFSSNVGNAFYAAGTAVDLINGDWQSVVNREIASRVNAHIPGPFGISIPQNNDPPKPDFPTFLSPDSNGQGGAPRETGPYPVFQWKGVEDARSYVVMVGRDDKLADVVYSEQLQAAGDPGQTLSVTYPSSARPLPPGTYYWRVVPIGEDEQPVKRGTQTTFNVKAQ